MRNSRMKKKLKIGIVGCGRVFDHYLKLFKNGKNSYMELIACCDTNSKLLKKVKQKYIQKYLDLNEMLNKESLSLLIVLTPSSYHYQHCKLALKKKINVLSEKPMCLKVKHGEELIKLSKKNKIFYGVVFQNRLNTALTFLKNKIDKNKLGKIIFCNVRLIWCRYNNYYEDGWHGTWSHDGGVLNQQLIHHLDAMVNIVSKIDELNSFSVTRINKLECEDSIVVSFKLKNGALGQIIGTTGYRPNDNEASIEIISDKGIYKIGGIALNEVSNWTENGFQKKLFLKKYSEKFGHGYGNGHSKLLKLLSNKLLLNKKVDNFSWSPTLALETSKVVSKIYKAIETKKNIKMTDKFFSSKLGFSNAK
jgi:UDP-N-acetyl-2-amino-2-deoxyglucuronate dehydrogenase